MTEDLRRRQYDQQILGWLRRIDAKLAGLDVRLQILAEICDRMTGWEDLGSRKDRSSSRSLQTGQDGLIVKPYSGD